LRDDVKILVAELSRNYVKKLHLIERLLLSDTDKLHYGKSENLEKVFEIIRDDAAIIEETNLIDYDISKAESALANLIGVKLRVLYDHLGSVNEARELVTMRDRVRENIEHLFQERKELSDKLKSASQILLKSIDDIARIGRLTGLKQPKKKHESR
jgi:hypothetical protein